MLKNRHKSSLGHWAITLLILSTGKSDCSYLLNAESLLKVPHEQRVLVGVQPPPEPLHVGLLSANSLTTLSGGQSVTVNKQSLIDKTR